MRRASSSDHDAAVARRLELLTAELAAVRGHGPAPPARPLSGAPQGPADPGPLPPDRGEGEEPDETSWWSGVPTRARTARVAAVPPETAGATDEVGVRPVLPRVPGRHASRRSRRRGDALPGVADTLRDRVAMGSGQLAVVAVAAVVGLVVTCWWLVRSGGHEVPLASTATVGRAALVTPAGEVASGATGAPSSGAVTGAGSRIVVDVAGKVRHPGIAVLRPGARVVDAIRAAGGARRRADLGSLNLARVLTDGEQVVVGAAAPGAVAGVPVPPTSAVPVTGLVNLNTADQTALESLPEVGPVTAQAILTWRRQHGSFTAVAQLLDVDGIGDATLAKLTPYVTI